ncbi:unnamed protein product [Oppiella nova]|uniref:Uncharacterized protein n=1 Tax=Oppiella nova TaxID=334625 RepID=A0A7R9LBP5_9ACAR|nr:unnamed protein product [Oppiella nova]CAG2161176.1 unnamed protein product [Oppiella nova]
MTLPVIRKKDDISDDSHDNEEYGQYNGVPNETLIAHFKLRHYYRLVVFFSIGAELSAQVIQKAPVSELGANICVK